MPDHTAIVQALGRLAGTIEDQEMVLGALAERSMLLDQLHEKNQDHSRTVAGMIAETVEKLERLAAIFAQHQQPQTHPTRAHQTHG